MICLIYHILAFLKFYIFIANITIDFSLFRLLCKYFNIILLFFFFFCYSLAENKSVYSDKLLPFNMKPINPSQKYANKN